jgi:hypothetical protein
MLLFVGRMKEGEKKYKGKFDVPNLSEENEPDEVDVRSNKFIIKQKLGV